MTRAEVVRRLAVLVADCGRDEARELRDALSVDDSWPDHGKVEARLLEVLDG